MQASLGRVTGGCTHSATHPPLLPPPEEEGQGGEGESEGGRERTLYNSSNSCTSHLYNSSNSLGRGGRDREYRAGVDGESDGKVHPLRHTTAQQRSASPFRGLEVRIWQLRIEVILGYMGTSLIRNDPPRRTLQ